MMRRFGTFGLGALALVLAVALPLAWGGMAALRASLDFSRAGWAGMVLLAGLAALARATRQQLLLRHLGAAPGVGVNLAASLATETAYALTPGGAGGPPASVWLLRRAGVPLPAALAVSAADPLFDALFFALALPLAALALTFETRVPALRDGAWLASGLLLLALGLVWLLRQRLLRWLCVLGRRRPRWRRAWRDLRSSLRELARGGARLWLPQLLLATVQWCARYGVLALILISLGHALPFALLLLLQGVALHAAQWTGAPAGAGGAELALGLVLSTLMPASSAASAVLLWRIGTLLLPSLAGALAFMALGARRVQPAPSQAI
ncbi:MAG: flippase-like domain-containing protein [Metallibacterium scheffleri]